MSFFLNPYAFGIQFMEGASGGDGAANANMAGASIAAAAFSADGAGVCALDPATAATVSAAFGSAGVGAETMVGASIVGGALGSDGAAIMDAAADPAAAVVDAADFSPVGLNYMVKGSLTGIADSKSGTISLWLRLDGSDGAELGIISGAIDAVGSSIRFIVYRTAGNTLRIDARNGSGTMILSMETSTTYLASSTWLNLLASWDLAAGTGHLYINDVDRKAAGSTLTNDTIDYTLANWEVGAATGNGDEIFDGCLADVWFAPGTYVDLSALANRRKFITSTGKPVIIGADGSTPTGSAPIELHHLDDGEAVANFAVNRGTGGNFTITGTLTTCSSSPSD